MTPGQADGKARGLDESSQWQGFQSSRFAHLTGVAGGRRDPATAKPSHMSYTSSYVSPFRVV